MCSDEQQKKTFFFFGAYFLFCVQSYIKALNSLLCSLYVFKK